MHGHQALRSDYYSDWWGIYKWGVIDASWCWAWRQVRPAQYMTMAQWATRKPRVVGDGKAWHATPASIN